MNRLELKNRWKNNNEIDKILNFFNTKDKSLVNQYNKMYESRVDLRGVVFGKINFENSSFNSEFTIKDKIFVNIDFSYCDFRKCRLIRCKFENCIFKETILQKVFICNSEFYNCKFLNANMSESFLNSNESNFSGSYIKCDFIECDFSDSSFNFPIIKNCFFCDCKLFRTSFDGSRFYDTIFVGVLDSTFFNGYSIYSSKSWFNPFNNYSKIKQFNRMENVDFSNAKLKGVSFNYGINLDKCILPKNKNNYVYINNPSLTFEKAIKEIESNWDKNFKYLALNYINKIYYTKTEKDPKTCLIDKYALMIDGEEFASSFINLISKYI